MFAFDGSCQEYRQCTASPVLPIDTDRWHHVAAVLSGTTKLMYLDGVQVFGPQLCSGVRRGMQLTNIYIGRPSAAERGSDHFEGLLDGEYHNSFAILFNTGRFPCRDILVGICIIAGIKVHCVPW